MKWRNHYSEDLMCESQSVKVIIKVKVFSWSYDRYGAINVNDLQGHTDEWEAHNSH